jgi:uncharacterized membrane protein
MINFLLQHTPLFYLTQSIWRDEAFSILLSERSPLFFLTVTFEPPVYYVLLHFWMKIFGTNEIIIRTLSLLGFMGATIIVIYWAEQIYKKHWLSWFLPVFFFCNPMLLYYAFEIRAYGWYIFFATASMYTYINKQWKWFVIATTLGLYTHTYMVIVPAVQVLHYYLTHRKSLRFLKPVTFFRDTFVRSVLLVGALFGPWFIKAVFELSKLKTSWYFPVDWHLIKSVLGNIFVGYEGTPWYLWQYTAGLSLVLLACFCYALRNKSTRQRNMFFFLQIFVPLVIIIGISFYKPLFVNRYIIPSTIAMVFLIASAIENMKNKTAQKLAAAGALLFVLIFNMWYPDKHAKLDIRTTIIQVNRLTAKNDYIFAGSPLVFFESIYYSKDRSRVFLYDPNGNPFPWYVGGVIVSANQMVTELPPYPSRAFIIKADGTYEIAYNSPIPNHAGVINNTKKK